MGLLFYFFFSSRRRHTRWTGDWSSDVCSSDLFAEAVGRPDWPLDARFATDAKRALHRNELRAEIEAELAVLTSEQALAQLRQAEIPVGPILGVREALAQPQALARAMVVEEEDGFRTIGSALKLGDPPRAPRPAPLFGEHQELIEGWLAEPPRT